MGHDSRIPLGQGGRVSAAVARSDTSKAFAQRMARAKKRLAKKTRSTMRAAEKADRKAAAQAEKTQKLQRDKEGWLLAKKIARSASTTRVVERVARGVLSDFEQGDFRTCPYCRTREVGECHVDRCSARAKIPILEARRAAGIHFIVARNDDSEEDYF